MKALFLYLSLILSITLTGQPSFEPIQNLEVKNENFYFKTIDGDVIKKHYASGSFEWTSPDFNIDVTLEIAQPVQNNEHIILHSLHILNDPQLFSAFSPVASGFFIEKNTVYFFMGPFSETETLELFYTGIGGGNPPPIQSACQPLPPIKIAVTPANPN